jgi:hypothetical protein
MNHENSPFYVLLAQRSVNDPLPGKRKIIKINSAISPPILWEETPQDDEDALNGIEPVKVRTLFLCLGIN